MHSSEDKSVTIELSVRTRIKLDEVLILDWI